MLVREKKLQQKIVNQYKRQVENDGLFHMQDFI